MSEHSKRISRLAILTAIGAVLLFITELVPAGRLGLMAAASFPVCIAVILYGPGWAAGVFAVTALLGFLLFPGTTAVGYGAFFGFYPILKSLIERLDARPLRLLLKTVVYGAAFLAYWFLAAALFPAGSNALPWYVLFVLGGAAFAFYDWCYSLIIQFFMENIARLIR